MKILIIEENSHLREFLHIQLEVNGFTVEATANPEKGLRLVSGGNYDLVILDYTLSYKYTDCLCSQIRETDRKIAIFIISDESNRLCAVDMFNAGANDYITKPFCFDELLARIHAMLRRPQQLEEKILVIDDLKVDTRRQRVLRGDKEIYLTRKEFLLLEYLLRHKSSVIPRSTILDHVWGSDSDPFSNTVEAHIFNLRRKLNAPKKQKLIHNVPGRGYKIDLQSE